MKNRTMARKLERARVQAREAAAIEFTKLPYLIQPSKRELRAMAPSFDSLIRRFVPSLWRAPLKLYCTRGGMGAAVTCRFLSC
jgi:hypothetical protein